MDGREEKNQGKVNGRRSAEKFAKERKGKANDNGR